MPNMNSLKPLLLLAVGFLGLPACSLPPPAYNHSNAGDAGATIAPWTCVSHLDGISDAGTGVTSSNAKDNVVPAVSCSGSGSNPNAIDKYSQGYKQDDAVVQKAKSTAAKMSLEDVATQMRGVSFGSAFNPQYNEIEESDDTTSIRGFRYRDASRGMDLG
ncbi:MAG TPA: hypothetical protein VIM14_08830, partial [Polyangia bacterium]